MIFRNRQNYTTFVIKNKHLMRFYSYLKYIITCVAMILLWSCSSTKHVPDGKYLVDNVSIKIIDANDESKNISSSELKNYLRQTPNHKVLGFLKLQLATYNLSGNDSTKWYNRWFRNLGQAPVIYNQQLTDISANQLKLAMINKGFLDAAVNVDTIMQPKKKKINVNYTIHAGEPHKVASITYNIPDTIIRNIVLRDSARLAMKAGDLLDRNNLDVNRATLSQQLRNRGYYNFSKETNRLIDNLQEWTGEDVTNAAPKCNKMVVIIGESYSKYHSQLYGYEKETSPLLAKRVEDGNLILYSDVITPINDTERSFRAVYSLGEYYNDVYSDCLLFPYIFKKSGYYTVNVDNLDLASKTNRVKDSKRLSNLIFDFRNVTTSQYDDEVLQWLDIDENEYPQQLFVIKLKGQHYDYANQFPASFAKYKVEDYDRNDLPDNKVQLIADYDNATIFNDYVVNSIIEYFEEDNSVVLYFSDHGEEVFDERDYMGHGGTTPYLNYQVEIPFMIWMSESYRNANPSVVLNILANKDLPYTTDDVSHTILDMAGIGCSQFVSERSLANDEFHSRESRVVMRSFVYDEFNTLRQL